MTIRAVSHKTGLAHEFEDVHEWEKLTQVYESKYLAKVKTDFLQAAKFDSYLKTVQIKTRPTIKLAQPVFRVIPSANPKMNPLSVSGSLADGGRLNMGGAQINPTLPHLTKWACLYVSQTLNCAQAEVAQPAGVVKKFQLTFKNNYAPMLWDLKLVIAELDYANRWRWNCI